MDSINHIAESTRNRPLRALFRTLLGVSLLVYLLSIAYIWKLNVSDTKVTLNHVNSVLAQGVRTTLKGHELILRGLGHELLAKGALEQPEAGRELIERMKGIDPGMAGFGLARMDGQLVLVSGIPAGASLPNLARGEKTAENFREAIDAGQLRTGRPYFFRQLGEWVVAIRVPLVDAKGKHAAIMTAGYRVQGGTTAWARNDLQPGISIAIVGEDGYLRYMQQEDAAQGSRTNDIFENPIAEQTMSWVRSMPATTTFSLRNLPIGGGYHYVSATRIKEYGLYSGAFIPRSYVVLAWFQRILVPTLLYILFVLGSLWAYRRTRQAQAESDAAVGELSAWQKAMLDGAEYSIISTDIAGKVVSYNRAAQQMLGYTPEEVIGKTTPALFHVPDEVEQRARQLSIQLGRRVDPGFDVFITLPREGHAETHEWTYRRKDGSELPVQLTVSALRGDNDEIKGFVGIAQDLSEKKAMSAHLRDSEARCTVLFEHAGDATFLVADGVFIDCNPAALKIFGSTKAQIIGKNPVFFSPPEQPNGESSAQLVKTKIAAALAGEPQRFEWLHQRQDGTPFDAEVSLNAIEIDGKPHVLGMVRDITERKRAEIELAYQARHDSLTGLPNRSSLHERVEKTLKTASEKPGKPALMLLDLNRFKEVNDTLGHHLGDEVLTQVGPRLKRSCADRDVLISRLGGDEFAIFVPDADGRSTAIAQGLLEALRQPFQVGGMEIRLGAAVGIALFPGDGKDSHELLRAADVAMYQAKKHSLGVSLYDRAFDEHSTERLALATELTDALQKNELVLHYQPKIDVTSGKTTGFEALVRWQHPQRGLLQPGAFIDLVEMSEIIHPFTQKILNLAVTDKHKLRQLGWTQPVAINLSAHNLQDARCFTNLESALSLYKIPAKEIEIELTETALMFDPENARQVLQQFNEAGINIYIDDFGTGYSSLNYLRHLPLQALKIDRSFVGDMLTNEADASIVRSTVALAHSLNLKVVAEGVEDDATLTLLRGMGCDHAQGYGICRPQPLDTLIDWLNEHPSS